jgi:hypothetical protein
LTPIDDDDDGTVTYQVPYETADAISQQLFQILVDHECRNEDAVVGVAMTLGRLMSAELLSPPESIMVAGVAIQAAGQFLNNQPPPTVH